MIYIGVEQLAKEKPEEKLCDADKLENKAR